MGWHGNDSWGCTSSTVPGCATPSERMTATSTTNPDNTPKISHRLHFKAVCQMFLAVDNQHQYIFNAPPRGSCHLLSQQAHAFRQSLQGFSYVASQPGENGYRVGCIAVTASLSPKLCTFHPQAWLPGMCVQYMSNVHNMAAIRPMFSILSVARTIKYRIRFHHGGLRRATEEAATASQDVPTAYWWSVCTCMSIAWERMLKGPHSLIFFKHLSHSLINPSIRIFPPQRATRGVLEPHKVCQGHKGQTHTHTYTQKVNQSTQTK